MQNTQQYAEAGVMIRETLAAGSKHAMVVIDPSAGTYFEYRTTAGSTTLAQNGPVLPPPYWLRVTRTGNSFAGYTSPDGNTWTPVGSAVTISMATNTYIGLPVSAHNYGVLCTSTITNVTARLAPSTAPVSLGCQVAGSTVELSWPTDHLGWRLQFQTNALSAGLGTNWQTWPDSTNLTSIAIPASNNTTELFFRLLFP